MRLFIATHLTPDLAESIGSRVASLQARLPRAAWVQPHSYHLTFAFLGEQAAAVLDPLTRAMSRSLASQSGGRYSAGLPGFFPSEGRPRTGWLSLEPSETFVPVAGRVRAAVRSVGIALDEKPFRPHLTLARMKEPWRRWDVDLFLDSFTGLGWPEGVLERVALIESRLTSDGPLYTELAGFDLTL